MNKLSFTGIIKPYTNKNGYKIIPITKDPSQEDIDLAAKAAGEGKKFAEGMRGEVYCLNQDLVVKKCTSNSSDNPLIREAYALDKMQQKGICEENIQEGKYAFITPDGGSYLVSSRIKGKALDINTNKFNNENLRSLVQLIEKLDETTNLDETFMHYDLSEKNIILTEKTAGIVDFEFMNFDKGQKRFLNEIQGKHDDNNGNMSDIAGVISNLRNFERRTLSKYLRQMTHEEAQELFENYIGIKADYHKKLAEVYSEKTENSVCEILANHHRAHAEVLQKAHCKDDYNDIIEAEARKIQISLFMQEQSECSAKCESGFNPIQVKDYLNETKEFFEKMYTEAKENNNTPKSTYYKDCINVLEGWCGVLKWMNHRIMGPDISPYDSNLSKDAYKRELVKHELILKKLDNKYHTTIDEIICS